MNTTTTTTNATTAAEQRRKKFLSKAELGYLTSKRQFSDSYSRTIKSRLQKKIERFANEELPLLVDKGLISSSILDVRIVTKFRNGSVTENCNNGQRRDSLLRISPQTNDKQIGHERIMTKTGPEGFDPSISAPPKGTCGSEDRRDILTTLRAQQAC